MDKSHWFLKYFLGEKRQRETWRSSFYPVTYAGGDAEVMYTEGMDNRHENALTTYPTFYDLRHNITKPAKKHSKYIIKSNLYLTICIWQFSTVLKNFLPLSLR